MQWMKKPLDEGTKKIVPLFRTEEGNLHLLDPTTPHHASLEYILCYDFMGGSKEEEWGKGNIAPCQTSDHSGFNWRRGKSSFQLYFS